MSKTPANVIHQHALGAVGNFLDANIADVDHQIVIFVVVVIKMVAMLRV
jgi:hypothetical protein